LVIDYKKISALMAEENKPKKLEDKKDIKVEVEAEVDTNTESKK